ncbi:hypothetical protein PAESOLCIP111_05062 [Paenibacillus solanacearum]|uniref:P68 RBP/TagC-like beta-propeller domain-containing protein n=1 Tax=Paenibacillus solanacearum TaxID=2048548 RepID=A0A916K8Q2_9BACL|nr:hypothetical protein [Paenibacillus solanacearum]CAG7645961.1 hypothetical protein PAESOLCIP111_05062 [Paenibacillus solanacearum]
MISLPSPNKQRNLTWLRRRLLVKIGAVALTAALLVPTLPPDRQASALGSLPTSKVFDLSDSSDMLIREKPLHRSTVLQSLAFDNVNQHIYTAQLIGGGLQLPGESSAAPAATRSSNGDLCITKLDFAGNIISYMFVKGAGHGVSIGVEPGIGQNGQPVAYLWTEIDSFDEGSGGRGSRVARFPFTDGAVVTPNTPWLEKHTIVPGSFNTTVSIDMAHGNLVMRYRLNGEYRFGVYNLEQVKQRNYVSLADIAQPLVDTSFQGYTSYGSYVYMLEGTAYGKSGSVSPDGNTYITAVNLNTGAVVDKQRTRAGYSLLFREPEGMGIQIPDMNNPGAARLAFGFASYISSTNTGKQTSIYYKDVLKP